MNVALAGKTQKGRNRVREHGRWWIVIEQPEGEVLVRPPGVRGEHHMRRVKLRDDPDFTVEAWDSQWRQT